MKRNAKKVELPQNFAQNLLQHEIQYKLSETPLKQTVKALIQLYSVGVQYYESIRSHKYLYFQMKMNEIFTSASTLNAINDKATSQADSPLKKKLKNANNEQQKIQALQIKQKQQKMFQEVVQNTSQSATVNTVKKMINDNDLKTIQTTEKVKKQIENQDMKLQQKLKQRKSRILFSKSFSSAGIMGQADTQDTLFTEVLPNQLKPGVTLKPIEVNFGSIINQNQSDDEQNYERGRRRMSISQDPSKKVRAEMQAKIKNVSKD